MSAWSRLSGWNWGQLRVGQCPCGRPARHRPRPGPGSRRRRRPRVGLTGCGPAPPARGSEAHPVLVEVDGPAALDRRDNAEPDSPTVRSRPTPALLDERDARRDDDDIRAQPARVGVRRGAHGTTPATRCRRSTPDPRQNVGPSPRRHRDGRLEGLGRGGIQRGSPIRQARSRRRTQTSSSTVCAANSKTASRRRKRRVVFPDAKRPPRRQRHTRDLRPDPGGRAQRRGAARRPST